MNISNLKLAGVYRHIKTGNSYIIIKFATHTETQEALVIYTRVDSPAMDEIWARPIGLFLQKFEPHE